MKKKATHRFNPNGKAVGMAVTDCLNNMIWISGSHGVLPPNMNVAIPSELTATDMIMVKNSVCQILLLNEASWQLILVAAFDNKEQRSYVSANIELSKWSLIEIGEKITELCEVTIRRMEQTFKNEGAVSLDNIHHYGYMLAPTQGLNVEIIEDRLIDVLENETFNRYSWETRAKITAKDFIDSISAVKF